METGDQMMVLADQESIDAVRSIFLISETGLPDIEKPVQSRPAPTPEEENDRKI